MLSRPVLSNTLALGLLVGTVCLAPNAHAAYLCDAPPSPLDAKACAAARLGAAELRHFIQRIRVIESLYFYDYVDDAQATAWRQQEERAAALQAAPTVDPVAAHRSK